MITKEESKIISVVRVTAMTLILLCHYVEWYPDIAFIGQFFNVGVPLFFIISGYLYGQKKIGNITTWLKSRYITLSVPLYVYYLLGMLLLFTLGLLGTVTFSNVVKVFLHLQGILGGGIGKLQTEHLWFVTFIFLCYLITPFLQRIELSRIWFFGAMVTACAVEIAIMIAFGSYKMLTWIPGIFSYVVGYYVAEHWNKIVSNRMILVLSAFLIAAVALRLLARTTIDGTRLYDLVIVPYTHCIIAFWIFFTEFWVCRKFGIVGEHLFRACKIIGSYSFEVYIVHYCLIIGVVSLKNLTSNMLVNTIAMLIGIIILSLILKKISGLIFNLLKN